MKVVIVAKTRMGSGACVGAVDFQGRSLRLRAPDEATNDRFNMKYEIGSVWEVKGNPVSRSAPHTEDFLVREKRPLPPIDDVQTFIEKQMPVFEGPILDLYEEDLEATKAGALYICQRNGVPPYSTLFWRPDQPLVRSAEGNRIRYRYGGQSGPSLTFVGFQEPVPELPAGALLRVSLAHWWQRPDRPDDEPRCYVQLSGWFLPDTQGSPLGAPSAPLSAPSILVDPARPPTLQSARELLKEVFGYEQFLPLQARIIDNVLKRKDSLAVMPTGSGKSLCYQLPALLLPGLTVVVSPLISLMQDQIEQLHEVGVSAVTINSSLSYPKQVEAVSQLRSGAAKLLYIAPESLLRPETLLLLEECGVACLAIDEAHCISEWGHDFRPEYRQLAAVRRRFASAVCLALTATATYRVRDDIRECLGISPEGELVASFDRPNLNLAVAPKVDALSQTLAFLGEHAGESGIVYCATRRQVEQLATDLNRHGIHALPYHAGMDNVTRRSHQRKFSRDDVAVIVATIAFGMGIDKSNVRFILHYDLPKNLESYYQQIGRAGRDGLPSDCLLLYGFGDVQTILFFIGQKPAALRRGAQLRLEALRDFVETDSCRRIPLLAYFGEEYSKEACGNCDICLLEETELVDLTVAAQKFLSCVKRTGELFGAGYIIKVLRGSRAQRVLAKGHDKLSTYNIGREFDANAWRFLARQFVQHGLLEQDTEYGGLSLTSKGMAVLRGEPFMGRLPERAGTAAHDDTYDYERDLFELLRSQRKRLADAAGVPPYVVFSDRTLVEMATYFPRSPSTLAQIYGVGRVKLEKYGEPFLSLVREFAEERGLAERRKPVASQSGNRGRAMEDVLAAYNDGASIQEIAAQRACRRGTVVAHLWRATQAGHRLRADGLLEALDLPEAQVEVALDAFSELGTDLLRPIYDALSGAVSWDDLRQLRLVAIHGETKVPQPRRAEKSDGSAN